MALDSYTKFRDYCLRALGQDGDELLKVNMTEDQIKDRIEDALKKWQDFHFEGSTLVSIHRYITSEDKRLGYLDVPELNAIIEIMTPNDQNKSNAEVMDDIDYRFHLEYADNHLWGGSAMRSAEMGLTDYYINMEYLASMRYLFTVDKLFTFNATSNRLYLQGSYDLAIPPDLLEEFRSNNWVAGTGSLITPDVEALANDNLEGTKLENTNAGVNPIHAHYTKTTKYYPRGLRTFMITLKSGTYTGRVRLRVKDRAGTVIGTTNVQPLTYWKSFEVTAHYKEGHINDYIFEIDTLDACNNQHFFACEPSGFRNNFIILVGYATANPDDIGLVWDSGWLKSYAVALMKRQWAQNLKKFEGIQMAGGVTLNAQAMYDEATAEIQGLNEELELKWTMPPAMIIG